MEWIERVEGVQGGNPVIRGTRIMVASVIAKYRRGMSLEEIKNGNYDIPIQAFEAAVVYAEAHPSGLVSEPVTTRRG